MLPGMDEENAVDRFTVRSPVEWVVGAISAALIVAAAMMSLR